MSVDPLACETRAVEAGAKAWRNSDGSYTVRSFSRDDVRHLVRPEIVGLNHLIRLSCSCEAGRARPSEAIACQHGSVVGRRLEREGWAIWMGGLWWANERLLRAKGVR